MINMGSIYRYRTLGDYRTTVFSLSNVISCWFRLWYWFPFRYSCRRLVTILLLLKGEWLRNALVWHIWLAKSFNYICFPNLPSGWGLLEMDLLFSGHTLGTLERASNNGKHLDICIWYIFFDGMVSDWSWFCSVSGLKCKWLSSLSGFSFLVVYLYKCYIHGIIFCLLDYLSVCCIELLISSVGGKQCDHNICIVTWTHVLVCPKWSNRMSDGTSRCRVGGTLLPPFCVLLLIRCLLGKYMWYVVFVSS